MQNITKNCADSLRAFAESLGIKLKASHAHELFAAFVGYKSKAAMQADILCPIDNLSKANIYVLTPSAFIDEQRKRLNDLSNDLPDSDTLGEALFPAIEQAFEGKKIRLYRSLGHLIEMLTTEYLKEHGSKLLRRGFNDRLLFDRPLDSFVPRIEVNGNEVSLIASNRYHAEMYGAQPVATFSLTFQIRLERIAGYVGYRRAEVSMI